MNIFYTNTDPYIAADDHCIVHQVKMILEYAQLLSTAHRITRHVSEILVLSGNRIVKFLLLPEEKITQVASTIDNKPVYIVLNQVLYSATHVNHPSAVWVRESTANYEWLHTCWYKLLHNFLERTGRPHKAHQTVSAALARTPPLPVAGLTPIRLAMPDEHRTDDPCISYQNYLNAKLREWLDRPRPMKVEFMYGEPDWLDVDRRSNTP